MSAFVHKSPPFRQISASEYFDGRASTKEMASAMVVRITIMGFKGALTTSTIFKHSRFKVQRSGSVVGNLVNWNICETNELSGCTDREN